MEQEQLEFFKLDEADRRVLLWLIDHVKPNSIKSWLEFIAEDYWQRCSIKIDVARLYKEIQDK
jgi:hypothetical protein